METVRERDIVGERWRESDREIEGEEGRYREI